MSDDIELDDMVIGQRYWLDGMKDVSAIYVGTDMHRHKFKDTHGPDHYFVDEDGTIGFANTGNGFKVFKYES